jgi:hypothetical protein
LGGMQVRRNLHRPAKYPQQISSAPASAVIVNNMDDKKNLV